MRFRSKTAAPVGHIDFGKGIVCRHCHLGIVPAGGIDQDRRCPEGGLHRLVGLRQAFRVLRIRLEKIGFTALLPNGLKASAASLPVSSQNRNAGPRGGESLGQGAAQNSGSTDNDGHFSGEIKELTGR